MNLVTFLQSQTITYNHKEKDNVYVECPWCGRETLSINVHTGLWHCWHADCSQNGNFHKFCARLKIPSPLDTIFSSAPPKVEKVLTKDHIDQIHLALSNKPGVIEYAASRGLDPSILFSCGVGFDDGRKAVVFSYRDVQGSLIGAKYKAQDQQWIVGQEPKLYAPDPKDLKKEKIIIVEGEVDALTLKQCGLAAVATLGAGKTKGCQLLSSTRSIYIGYDMDAGGDTGSEKLIKELGAYRCRRIMWGAKDPNDWLQAGATREEIIEAVKRAKPCAEAVASISGLEALNTYFEEHEKGVKPRRSWGFKGIDALTRGIGGGEVVGILAESGTGKTTFLINTIVSHLAQGIKVGFASLEEHPIHEITPKLYSACIGRNIAKYGMSREDATHIEKELSMVHLYNKSEDVEEVSNWIRECYYLHGCKMVAIDYLQLMVKDEESVQDIKKTAFGFKKLVKEMPDLCILLIIQPKQKQRMRTKEGKEAKPLKLDGSDARGGSALNQSVDKMLTICGVPGNPNITQYEFTKVRGHLNVSKKDWLNKIVQLEYDHDTLRMSEVPNIIYGND